MAKYEPNPAFGKVLRQLREARGWTQREFADRLHLSRAAMSQTESGMRLPSNDFMLDILCVLQPTPDEFLRLMFAMFNWQERIARGEHLQRRHQHVTEDSEIYCLDLSPAAVSWLRRHGVSKVGAARALAAATSSPYRDEILHALPKLSS